jgi:hypothetical protein
MHSKRRAGGALVLQHRVPKCTACLLSLSEFLSFLLQCFCCLLLQVEWYPWGEEAFEAAKQQDKPIFLSVGYATCHW